LPDTLKYAYLDEKKIYLVIINANLSEHEKEKLLKDISSTRLLDVPNLKKCGGGKSAWGRPA